MAVDHVVHASDVFISYAREDLDWVARVLVPALESRGSKCRYDQRDMRVGDKWRAWTAEEIRKCRHVLLVLTPMWMASVECDREAYAAYVLDPWEMNGKLVPIERIACVDSAPDWIRSRNILSFTAAEPGEATWQGLIAVLQSTPKVQGPEVSWGEMLREYPDALRSMGACSVNMRRVSDGVKRIKDAKELHDGLHELEAVWPLVLADYHDVENLPDERAHWAKLNKTLKTARFAARVGEIKRAADATPEYKEAQWVVDIAHGARDLQQAIDRRLSDEAAYPDPEQNDFFAAAVAFQAVQFVVLGQPSHLNQRIVEEAEPLPLLSLAEGLESLLATPPDSGPPGARRPVDRIRELAWQIRQLKDTLRVHVGYHRRMQALHDAVARIEPNTWSNAFDFRRSWALSKRPMEPLVNAQLAPQWWTDDLLRLGTELTAKAQEGVFRLDAAKNRFDEYRECVLDAFLSVDTELRKFCETRLAPLGAQLAEIIDSVDMR